MQYESPRNIFQSKVNAILNRESKNSELFEDIFKLQQVISFEKLPSNDMKDQWSILLELFTLLGSVQFAKVISIIKGRSLSFPSEEEYQDSITTTLCYYYKEVQNLSWDDIKEKLNDPKLNAIKYGIRVRQLKGFIDEQLFKKLTLEEETK
jgi:hypothetical protein